MFKSCLDPASDYMTSTAPNGLLNLFDFFVFISIFVSPLFSLVFTPLSTSVFPFLLYITPTVFRLVSLYELLLYLNFRIVLERVKQKGRIWQIVVFLLEN